MSAEENKKILRLSFSFPPKKDGSTLTLTDIAKILVDDPEVKEYFEVHTAQGKNVKDFKANSSSNFLRIIFPKDKSNQEKLVYYALDLVKITETDIIEKQNYIKDLYLDDETKREQINLISSETFLTAKPVQKGDYNYCSQLHTSSIHPDLEEPSCVLSYVFSKLKESKFFKVEIWSEKKA